MIIVAGWLRVPAETRTAYLSTARLVVELARAAPGCIDFALSPDSVDNERINVFEQWETVEAVEQFRGAGPTDEQQADIIGAHVEQHEVSNTKSLT